MGDNTLKVRIVINSEGTDELGADATPQPEKVTSAYRYDRVAGCVLALILVIATTYSAFVEDAPDETPSLQGDALTGSVATAPSKPVKILNPDTPVPSGAAKKPADKSSANLKNQSDKATTALTRKKAAREDKALTIPKPDHPIAPAVTRIRSGSIKRAQLTSRMKNREPTDKAGKSIYLERGMSKVYFFTEVLGKSGEKITHTWYRNGKPIAKVNLAIGSNRWRCYSSKNLSRNMGGQWSVKVSDQKGKVLASSAFEFITKL